MTLFMILAEIPINPETVPGSVIIPTWLLVSAIVSLVGAIGSMFWLLMHTHRRELDFAREQLKNKEEECKDLGKLLNGRYKDLKRISREMSSAVEIVKIVSMQEEGDEDDE